MSGTLSADWSETRKNTLPCDSGRIQRELESCSLRVSVTLTTNTSPGRMDSKVVTSLPFGATTSMILMTQLATLRRALAGTSEFDHRQWQSSLRMVMFSITRGDENNDNSHGDCRA